MLIKNWFRVLFPAIPHDVSENSRNKKITGLKSRGNVNLQSGRYVTKDDVDFLRKRVLN